MASPWRSPLLPLVAFLQAVPPTAARREGVVHAGALALGSVDDPILSYDARSYATDQESRMNISRQGETVYEGIPGVYEFDKSSLGREFLVDIDHASEGVDGQCKDLIFVKRERLPGLCGTGLFTQPRRSCSELPVAEVEAEVERLKGLMPPSDRGFSVELELVGRSPSQDDDPQWPRLGAFGTMLTSKFTLAQECFDLITGSREKSTTCSAQSDCSISEFCAKSGVCRDRLLCEEAEAPEGGCPVAAARWNWEDDPTVVPLTSAQAAALRAGKDEQDGLPFEVTSPGPPHVLSGRAGMRSVIEVMTVLRHMGVQAGPSSGMHVHVNMLNEEVPGEATGFHGVAGVWAAYARYQFVIDEMLSPGRPGNRWGHRLFLGSCPKKTDSVRCSTSPCGCLRVIWERMHDFVKSPENITSKDLCNRIHSMKGWRNPCTARYPHQRYFQVNLIPMVKFGTIEFRAHSATTDVERIARWAQFLVAFVEHFGLGAGRAKMDQFFEGTADDDYVKLQNAQRTATAEDLFSELAGVIDKDSADYFMGRLWEKGDAACDPPTKAKSAKTRVQARCTPKDDDFVTATVAQELPNGEQSLHVALPDSASLDTVTILLPDGKSWTVSFTSLFSKRLWVKLPTGRSIFMGGAKSFIFRYNPKEEKHAREEAVLARDYRCCCEYKGGESGKCLWFKKDLTTWRGKCPPLRETIDGNRCIAKTACDGMFARFKNKANRCVQTHHNTHTPPSRCLLTHNTIDENAYFQGGKC